MILPRISSFPHLQSIFKVQLISGSLIMIFGSFFTSFINYIFHLILGRVLGPSDYGTLASVMSLIGLLGLISSSVGLVVTKVVAGAKGKEDINQQVYSLNRHIWLFGIISFIPLLLLSPLAANFLKVQEFLLIIGLLVFLLSFPVSVLRGVLQGLVNFKYIVFSQMAENLVRLVGSVFLVLLGFSVAGGLLGLFLGACVGWLVAWAYAKDYLKDLGIGKLKINFKSMLRSSIPFLILSISITSMYSSDLILVKHFFSSFDAGIYAAMSFLGRIIFFAVSPVTAVMFPIAARHHANGENSLLILKLSLAGGFLISLILNIVYGAFPKLVVLLLYGENYLQSSELLIYFGIFITLVTLSFLLLNYELIINRYKPVWVSLIASLFQVIFIWYYHSSLYSVILVSIAISLSLFIYLLFDIFVLHKSK